jgi:hypothetical protein
VLSPYSRGLDRLHGPDLPVPALLCGKPTPEVRFLLNIVLFFIFAVIGLECPAA